MLNLPIIANTGFMMLQKMDDLQKTYEMENVKPRYQ